MQSPAISWITQERPRAVTEQRWEDRVTTDFSWSGNVYDFYRIVYAKLSRDLKVPFSLQGDQRVSETPVHEAIREALVNTLIHADYAGSCSILVVKRPDLFGFRNPGLLRVPVDEAIRGGVSDCRNRKLQKMFQLVGLGEQSGFGFPKIYGNWSQQHWRRPELEQRIESNQTLLAMRMTSLLPPEAIDALRQRYGDRVDSLSNPERIALVTAQSETCVTHSRLKELTKEHPRELSQALHGLVERGLLNSEGKGKATFYFLPGEHPIQPTGTEEVFNFESPAPIRVKSTITSSEHSSKSSDYSESNSDYLAGSSDQSDIPRTEWDKLMNVALPIRRTSRNSSGRVRQIILRLIDCRYLTLTQLSELLGRQNDGLRNNYINPMLEEGLLEAEFANIKNHPKQRYRAASRIDTES